MSARETHRNRPTSQGVQCSPRNRLTKFAGTALVAGALGLAAVATAGTAGALSSTDDAFLTEISAEGISYDSPKAAISDAHDVCCALDDGADPVDLGRRSWRTRT